MKSIFYMPKPVKITGRTSSITNSFVNGIIPVIIPKKDEVLMVLDVLGMDEQTVRCSYCYDAFTEWDHFQPIVRGKMPTGYISEIHNLVPACGKCNQSKGNSYWKDWINGNARLSPTSRNIENLRIIITNLEKYEAWSRPTIINFESLVGTDIWQQHWRNCEDLHARMRESQKLSDKIKNIVLEQVAE